MTFLTVWMYLVGLAVTYEMLSEANVEIEIDGVEKPVPMWFIWMLTILWPVFYSGMVLANAVWVVSK